MQNLQGHRHRGNGLDAPLHVLRSVEKQVVLMITSVPGGIRARSEIIKINQKGDGNVRN